MEEGKRRYVIPLALFAAALLVRVPGLGKWCLTVDEFYFYKAVSFILERGIPEFPGGGYYTRGLALQYLSALPVSLIRNQELAIRILPLLFGTLTVPIFYLFCRKFLGKWESILCALILLLSSWHIEFSRFARMYIPFQFFFLLFLYFVHSGFRENLHWQKISAWIVAAFSVFVYEGSIFPVLLLSALILTGDACKTKKDLFSFSVLLVLLICLNLLMNMVDYRSLGILESVSTNSMSLATSAGGWDLPVILPDIGLINFAWNSWLGKAILLLMGGGAVLLTIRGLRFYEGWYPRPLLFVTLLFLSFLPVIHQFGMLAILWIPIVINRKDLHRVIVRDLQYWGIYLLCAVVFWGVVAKNAGHLDRILHFLVGYPPIKYAVAIPYLKNIPLWALFLAAVTVISILRNILFRQWDEDVFPLTMLILCMAFVAIFATPYRFTRYSFFFFPLFILVSMGEIRVLRMYMTDSSWIELGRRGGAILIMAPLIVFLGTEDFHLRHIVDVSSAELNFRIGPYRRFSDHWYPRADIETPAQYVEKEFKEGDVVVLEQASMSLYLNKPFVNYVAKDSDRYHGIMRNGGTREIWTGKPLISNPRQTAEMVPINGGNSLWFLGILSEFPGGSFNMAKRSKDMSREYDLAIEQVYSGIDGRIGVWRITRAEN